MPASSAAVVSPFRDLSRTETVASRFRETMEALGLDLSDPNLADTPSRVARAYRELFAGLEAPEPTLRTFPRPQGRSGPVIVGNIPFYSLCAHHFLPFFGQAHIAYLPHERLLGLSKFARVVDFYARRPQIQERLTSQIADLLHNRLRPEGVLVQLEARHFCMEMRGVMKADACTTTISTRGVFDEREMRNDVMPLIYGAQPRSSPAGSRPARPRRRAGSRS
jgi:GTP cyclohydrolase IA